jgi:hypothetical protein
MSKTLYVCKNAACTLGTAQQFGRFTGGITAEQKHLLTGQPVEALKKGVDYGDGVCTNCGQPGEPYDKAKATASAVAEAKKRHAEELAALKEGVL